MLAPWASLSVGGGITDNDQLTNRLVDQQKITGNNLIIQVTLFQQKC